MEKQHIALYSAAPPSDPNGSDTAMSVMLPATTMEKMIISLRDALISHAEAGGDERKARIPTSVNAFIF